MTRGATSGAAVDARPVSADTAPPGSPTFVMFEADNGAAAADGSTTWVVRGQNALLEYSSLVAGAQLEEYDGAHECVVLAPTDSTRVRVAWEGEEATLDGRGLVIVPPGRSTVTALEASDVVRLLPEPESRWVGPAINAADYLSPSADVAPYVEWPEPTGPEGLRRYLVRDAPKDQSRFGNIFRSRGFMVNFLNVDAAPRDPEKLSPHAHEDFEQISLAVEGEYVHHIRIPWTARSSEWRDDVHHRIGTPSVAVIRPRAIHTSQSVGPGPNALIDIFSPPRRDFSLRPGLVLNHDDYPVAP